MAASAFARHETFHPRYGWLKKGFELASSEATVFLRDDAHVVLGVGKNMASAVPPPDSQAEYEELVLAVHRAVLTKLPRPLQDIMSRVLEDESQVQIADELQVNEVTVRTRLRRARSILRRELARYLCCDRRPGATPG